jgi:predicted XRE-type DNA-binding protein
MAVKRESLAYDSIFDAIAADRGEAADLQFRADMMLLLRNYFESKKWTQAEIGQRLGIAQPHVSELVRGRMSISSDKLISYLAKVGYALKPSFHSAGRVSKVRCDVEACDA